MRIRNLFYPGSGMKKFESGIWKKSPKLFNYFVLCNPPVRCFPVLRYLRNSPTNLNTVYTIYSYIVYSAGLLTFSLHSELIPSYQITLSRSNYKILQEQTNWPSPLITKLNSAALLVM
jgi:hypothetical protein